MEIIKVIFEFLGFIWVTSLIAIVLCYFKHMEKPKADNLIDEMDLFINGFGGKKNELK